MYKTNIWERLIKPRMADLYLMIFNDKQNLNYL